MTLVRTFQVGGLRCHLLEGGRQRLDGGAMFGVVPWTLWTRRIAPDERNRIPLAMRCLLVEHPDGLVLVDTALGNKEDPKFLDIYGIDNRGRRGPTQLDDALAEAGYRADEVRWVINTHLHFDHAGGNTVKADGGAPQGSLRGAAGDEAIGSRDAGSLRGREASEAIGLPLGHPIASSPAAPRNDVRIAFPNATYVVQRNELEFARKTNERTRASYLPPNFEPIAAAGRWRLLEGDGTVLPGISVRLTPGHVPFHQAVLVQDRGETAAFVADLVPTTAHLPLVWIMGYDLEPLRTLESKRALLRDAVAGGWRLLFEHDAVTAAGIPVEAGKGIELRDVIPAGDVAG